MHLKKLALISILAVIVLSCVFAAGCTTSSSYSSTSTNTVQSADGVITTTVNDNGKVSTVTSNVNDFAGKWKLDFNDAVSDKYMKGTPEFANALLKVVNNLNDVSSILVLHKNQTMEGIYVLKSTGEEIASIGPGFTWEPVSANSVRLVYGNITVDTFNYDPVAKTLALPDNIEVFTKVE